VQTVWRTAASCAAPQEKQLSPAKLGPKRIRRGYSAAARCARADATHLTSVL